MNTSDPTKVVTGPDTRWSYANVWEPKSINGSPAKYSVCLLIPKSDEKTLSRILAAERAAYVDGQSKFRGRNGEIPKLEVLKRPLRDGDLEHPGDPAYAGMFFLNASSATAPDIVDRDRQEILDHSEVYSGVYGRASIRFYPFSVNGNKGIAAALLNLQKCRNGASLGSRSTAWDDFAEDEDDEDIPW